jgi:hypothetical protein
MEKKERGGLCCRRLANNVDKKEMEKFILYVGEKSTS